MNIEKFTWKNNFGLWRIKMRALLTQHGLGEALSETEQISSSNFAKIKAKILEKAHSMIILCLRDKVLREVSKEIEALGVWKKLESFQVVNDLENLDVKLEDEDKTLMLLNSLPKSYKTFKDTLLFGRQLLLLWNRVRDPLIDALTQRFQGKEIKLFFEKVRYLRHVSCTRCRNDGACNRCAHLKWRVGK
ncbi:hypothetical protein ACS0TY_034655 [Phlomoides rotata]